MRSAPLARLALPALIFAAAAAAFWPAADADFVGWDDDLVVTRNHQFRGFGSEQLDWMFRTSWAGHYQPLSWMSLALDHRLYGLTPPRYPESAGFHRTNIAIHAAGAVALYGLALLLLARARPAARGSGRLAVAAALVALLHAVHPLRCESVCWVTERRDVLSGLFFVLALWAWLRALPRSATERMDWRPLATGAGAAVAAVALLWLSVSTEDPRRLGLGAAGWPGLVGGAGLLVVALVAAGRGAQPRLGAGWLCAAWLCLWLSLLAKAWGIVMPALLLVLDVWPLRRWRGTAASAAALVLEKAPFWALTLLFGRLAQWAQAAQQQDLDPWAIHTLSERLLQACYGIGFYVWKTLWPTGLAPLYSIPDHIGLDDPRFAVAALAVLAATALWVALARRFPAGLAAWVAYIATVSPVLGLAQSGPQLVADRYSYLATLPFALLAGGAWLWATERGRAVAPAAHAAAATLLLALGALSWQQSHVWRSAQTLWERAVEASPDSPLVMMNLGMLRVAQAVDSRDPGRRQELLAEAGPLMERAVAARPENPLYRLNLAGWLARRAESASPPQQSALLERAVAQAEAAVARADASGLADASYHWNLGRIRLQAGRLDASIQSFERAVALEPRWPSARAALGGALVEAARRRAATAPADALLLLERALPQLEAASGSDAHPAQIRFLVGSARDLEWQILLHLDRPESAARARRQALDAYRAVPDDDPRAERARLRIRALGGGAG